MMKELILTLIIITGALSSFAEDKKIYTQTEFDKAVSEELAKSMKKIGRTKLLDFSKELLDKEKALVGLDELGFHETDFERFHRIIKKPNGIFLVTGPTGSGKTTTL